MQTLRQRCRARLSGSEGTVDANIEQAEELSKEPVTSDLSGGQLTAVCVLCAAYNDVMHSKTCNFMFDCGCTWLFRGGWVACNVHLQPPNPRCPWCLPWFVLGPWFHLWQLQRSPEQDGLVVLSMVAACVTTRRHGFGRCAGLMAAITAYYGMSFLVGFAYKVALGYPYFLGFGESLPHLPKKDEVAPHHAGPYLISLAVGIFGSLLWGAIIVSLASVPWYFCRALSKRKQAHSIGVGHGASERVVPASADEHDVAEGAQLLGRPAHPAS